MSEFKFPHLNVPAIVHGGARAGCECGSSRVVGGPHKNHRVVLTTGVLPEFTFPNVTTTPVAEVQFSQMLIAEQEPRNKMSAAPCTGLSGVGLPSRFGRLGVSKPPTSGLVDSLGESLCPFLEPPAPPQYDAVLGSPNPASPFNSLQWGLAFLDAISWAYPIIYNVKYFLNALNNLPSSLQGPLWKFNDEFFDGETMGRGSLQFWFGDRTPTKIQKVRAVINGMLKPLITAPFIRFRNNWTTHPQWSEQWVKDGALTCGAFWAGEKFLNGHHTIWFCAEWPAKNIYERWSNIMHELTHAAGTTHQCSSICLDPPKGDMCVNSKSCDTTGSSQALLQASDFTKLFKNSGTFTNFIWCFFRAHTEHKCYPLSVADFGPGGQKVP